MQMICEAHSGFLGMLKDLFAKYTKKPAANFWKTYIKQRTTLGTNLSEAYKEMGCRELESPMILMLSLLRTKVKRRLNG